MPNLLSLFAGVRQVAEEITSLARGLRLDRRAVREVCRPAQEDLRVWVDVVEEALCPARVAPQHVVPVEGDVRGGARREGGRCWLSPRVRRRWRF